MLRGKNKEKGFTLIELILVIVILGILTAVALPRFIDLDADARTARRQGTLAAFRGAITMLHGKFLISNANTYNAATVLANSDLEGSTGTGSTATDITVDWGDGVETYNYNDNGGLPAKATMVCDAGNPC